MRLPPTDPAGLGRPRGTGVCLALAAGLMAIAAILPGTAGFGALALGVTALAASGGFALRGQWRALQAEADEIAPAVAEDVADITEVSADLSRRLRQLREEHVARVDAALDEGCSDEARRLTDAYTDAALAAILDSADVSA